MFEIHFHKGKDTKIFPIFSIEQCWRICLLTTETFLHKRQKNCFIIMTTLNKSFN